MERFSATVSKEELKALKAREKNAKTTKSACQWLCVFLGQT